jgi:hypothetical protein
MALRERQDQLNGRGATSTKVDLRLIPFGNENIAFNTYFGKRYDETEKNEYWNGKKT